VVKKKKGEGESELDAARDGCEHPGGLVAHGNMGTGQLCKLKASISHLLESDSLK
jgi:hypothetical protein